MSEETSHYFETTLLSNIESEESSDLDDVNTIPFENSIDRDLEEQKDKEEVYFCLLIKKGKIGGAFYEIQNGILSLISDYQDTTDYFYIKQSILQLNPTTIILSSACDPAIVAHFKNANHSTTDTFENEATDFSSGVELISSKEFSLDLGERRLLEADLPYIPNEYSSTERHTFMKSLIPFHNELMVRSTSALISYLQGRRVGVELEPIAFDVPLVDICFHVPNSIMYLGRSVLKSLEIFVKVSHPSAFKKGQIGSTKEGFSLYNFLDTCRSNVGSQMLRNWLLRPLCNLEEINARLNTISMLIAPMSQQTVIQLENATKLLGNIRKLFLRMRQSTVTCGMWASFCKTLNCFIILHKTLEPFCNTELDIADKVNRLFSPDIMQVVQYVLDVVDVESTIREREFTVKADVFPELDHMRESYMLLPGLLSELAKEEMKRLKEIIEECAIIYTPLVGYLITIPKTYEFPEGLDEHGLLYMYSTEDVSLYRNDTTNELNKNIGDIYMQIRDFQTDVMHDIQSKILQITEQLLKAVDLAAEIDCLLALTTAAKTMNAVAPVFIPENKICIVKGRHPLLQLQTHEYVPNSTMSGGGHPPVSVITGPNSCGKSVYLKQVGLLIYLAHIGSFVPAESMHLGVIKSIHTRIKSIESSSTEQSSFLTDCNELGMAIRDNSNHAGDRQLILLDEFGSGANSMDVMSIIVATLDYFLNQIENCPHILLSTHYHLYQVNSILKKWPMLSYKTLKSIFDEEGNVIYLYEITEGYCDNSFATFVARMVGIEDDIIERGEYVMSMLSRLEYLPPIEMPDLIDIETEAEDIAECFLVSEIDTSMIDQLSERTSYSGFDLSS